MASTQTTESDILAGLINKVDALKLDSDVQSVQLVQPSESVDLPVEDQKHEPKNFTEADLPNLLYYSLHLKQSNIFSLLTDLKIMYYQKKQVDMAADTFTVFSSQIEQFNQDDYFVIQGEQIYLLNSAFHITMFYNGGKKLSNPVGDEKSNLTKCTELEEIVGSDVNVQIDQMSISQDFITIRVKNMIVPYYGNPIKHITVGISKMPGKKIKPVDSPTAFIADNSVHMPIDPTSEFSILELLEQVSLLGQFDWNKLSSKLTQAHMF
jgi:hypothetical protein